MTISHGVATRNNIADVVLADIDVGSNGLLVFRQSGDEEVATLTFSDPAGVVSAEDLTFSAITPDTDAAGGVVAKATIETSAAAIILTANSVLTSGGDITMSSLTVGAGDTVSCSSLVYTAPV